MSALDHQEGGNHYAKLSIQPIEYIHANGLGFAEGSVIKYVTRWRDKNGIADLKKARHFLDLLIELEEKRGIVGMTAQDAIERLQVARSYAQSEEFKQGMRGFVGTSADWNTDKELPSSGIYDDEGYTEADKQAASLDPALVDLCSKTTIHADADGWIAHVGDKCPVSDKDALIDTKGRFVHSGESFKNTRGLPAGSLDWKARNFSIEYWRHHK